MKRRIICLGLIVLLIFSLCSCKKKKADNEIKAVDFSDYTVEDVIAWANENNVITKFEFEYVKDAEKAPGSVISQSVKAGETIEKIIIITAVEQERPYRINVPTDEMAPDSISISGDPVKVPNVIGITYSAAKDQLVALGFQVDTKYERSSSEKDIVIFSDPFPGMFIPAGSKVVLTISTGAN